MPSWHLVELGIGVLAAGAARSKIDSWGGSPAQCVHWGMPKPFLAFSSGRCVVIQYSLTRQLGKPVGGALDSTHYLQLSDTFEQGLCVIGFPDVVPGDLNKVAPPSGTEYKCPSPSGSRHDVTIRIKFIPDTR